MRRIIIPVVIFLTVLIMVGGFFLPSFAATFKDQQTIGTLSLSDGCSLSVETKSEINVLDRLKMISTASSIALDKGKNMDSEIAYQCALTELEKFFGSDLIEFDFVNCRLTRSGAVFYIDSTNPSKNLIAWDITITDGLHTIRVFVDDETGIVLSINYSMDLQAYKNARIKNDFSYPSVSIDPEILEDCIVDYYGLTIGLSEVAKTEETGKYVCVRFELSDGQGSITVGINFTGTGFWVNA